MPKVEINLKEPIEKALQEAGFNWKSLRTAPKDGSTIEFLEYSPQMSKVYTAWWAEGERHDTCNGVEYDGHCWVLNDCDVELIEEATNLDNWYWRPLCLAGVKERT